MSARIPFASSPNPTLGVEIELQILDPESKNLKSGSLLILDRIDEEMPIKQELTQSTIEVITGIETAKRWARIPASSLWGSSPWNSKKPEPTPR